MTANWYSSAIMFGEQSKAYGNFTNLDHCEISIGFEKGADSSLLYLVRGA